MTTQSTIPDPPLGGLPTAKIPRADAEDRLDSFKDHLRQQLQNRELVYLTRPNPTRFQTSMLALTPWAIDELVAEDSDFSVAMGLIEQDADVACRLLSQIRDRVIERVLDHDYHDEIVAHLGIENFV